MDIIRRCLDPVVDLVDEIIVYVDHKWSANTLIDEYDITLIKSINLDGSVVEQHRNSMLDDSVGDWVLILDPDEYLDDDAIRFLKDFKDSEEIVEKACVGYAFPRKNYEYNEQREVIYLNNYPDAQLRLIRSNIRYPGRIHEPPVIPFGRYVIITNGHIIHDKRHESYEEWYRKLLLYRSKGGHDDVEL